VDLTVGLGADADPYNYSDMTGLGVLGTFPSGAWTIVQDSGITGAEWFEIDWNNEPQGFVPLGASIVVEARASETQAGLPGQTFIEVSKDAPFSLAGRFIEVRTTLRPNEEGQSPVLSDLRINPLDDDEFEPNDTIPWATVLGSLPQITLRELTIPDAEDVDYFQITAQETGKLVINCFFANIYGDIDIRALDADGNLLAESSSSTDDEQIVIPVVSQERYFLQVSAIAGETNIYDLEIENFPAPVPNAVVLDPLDDTGMSNSDDVTSDSLSRIFVEADLWEFAGKEIDVPSPDEASAGEPGAAVEVIVNGLPVGFATPIAGTNNTLFQYTFAAGDLSTTFIPAIGGSGLNFVKAAVRIFDGQVSADGVAVSGRSLESDPLLLTLDRTPPDPSAPDMLAASDTGFVSDDDVTNITSPAFQGAAEANAKVRVLANGELVGQAVAAADGRWEVTVEPLDDGVYEITTEIEDLAGNIGTWPVEEEEPLTIEIDTLAPNLAFLDLVERDDSGRHDDDNVTNVNQPLFTATTHDPNAANHIFAENFEYRLFDRLEESNETLLFDSHAQISALTAATFITTSADLASDTTAIPVLADGIHNLKLEVEDRAGNISADFLLDVLIDTEVPDVSLGLSGNAIDGIDLSTSDTGVKGVPATYIDRITSDTGTGFWGRAESDAIVRLYVDGTPDDTVNSAAEFSLTVSQPADGDDALPEGQWNTSFIRDLNDPVFFAFGGIREVLVEAEDLAGNVNTVNDQTGDADQVLEIFIDTQGPQIYDPDGPLGPDQAIQATGHSDYGLFGPKPHSQQGPTPEVNGLIINVRDLPLRAADDFLYRAVEDRGTDGSPAAHPGHYHLVGDANGVVVISEVIVTNDLPPADGQHATATIELKFAEPLPDDRYTLWIEDDVVDPAGNHLDGESNAREPNGDPKLPTGDGVPGGDLVGRFTIDTRAEIGVWSAGSVWVDTNGNLTFDPEGQDRDDTNQDITYVLGFTSDNIFAGNFADLVDDPATPEDDTVADGFAKLAAYGFSGVGAFRWLIDTDNNGVPNIIERDPAGINGLPIAGNFDGDVDNGDEVGLKTGTTWWLDTTHNINVNQRIDGDLDGYPIVGDFDGDGVDDLGAWTDNTFQLDLSSTRTGAAKAGSYDVDINGIADVTFTFGFIGVRERPIAADFDGDGIDDIGLAVPDRSGATPTAETEWYILVSGGESFENRIVEDPQDGGFVVDFTPRPFGNDLYAKMGDEFALPVVGNFDPPVTADPPPQYGYYSHTNPDNHLDVDGNGYLTPLDALILIDVVNAHGSGYVLETFRSEATAQGPYFDPSGNLVVSALDVLLVINGLNAQSAVGGEGEAEIVEASAPNVAALPAGPVSAVTTAPAADRPDVAPEDAGGGEDEAAAQAIAYQAPVVEAAEVEFESFLDASGVAVEDLLDDLAEDVASIWPSG
jgi:hypothetical protein